MGGSGVCVGTAVAVGGSGVGVAGCGVGVAGCRVEVGRTAAMCVVVGSPAAAEAGCVWGCQLNIHNPMVVSKMPKAIAPKASQPATLGLDEFFILTPCKKDCSINPRDDSLYHVLVWCASGVAL
ncbi:MAG: hypothetical protein JXA89_16030, partial [Anaerolineae bacterium]|nr:hypothetical protein [Anaerolineae bacterium]